jgi:hypothetical protein
MVVVFRPPSAENFAPSFSRFAGTLSGSTHYKIKKPVVIDKK